MSQPQQHQRHGFPVPNVHTLADQLKRLMGLQSCEVVACKVNSLTHIASG